MDTQNYALEKGAPLKYGKYGYFWYLPHPETNSSHLKIGRAPKGNKYSNHPFSGAMLVSGRVVYFPTVQDLWFSVTSIWVIKGSRLEEAGNMNPSHKI